MRDLFDKLRGVQGKLDRRGNLNLDEIEPTEKRSRKEGINDLMKQLNRLEKKSAIATGDSGQRLYEDRTINDFKRDITTQLDSLNTGKGFLQQDNKQTAMGNIADDGGNVGEGRSRINLSHLNRIKNHLRKFNSKKNTHYNTAKAFHHWKELTNEWKE